MKWNDFEKEQPNDDTVCVVYIEHSQSASVGRYSKKYNSFIQPMMFGIDIENVTHWAEITKPPKPSSGTTAS